MFATLSCKKCIISEISTSKVPEKIVIFIFENFFPPVNLRILANFEIVTNIDKIVLKTIGEFRQ